MTLKYYDWFFERRLYQASPIPSRVLTSYPDYSSSSRFAKSPNTHTCFSYTFLLLFGENCTLWIFHSFLNSSFGSKAEVVYRPLLGPIETWAFVAQHYIYCGPRGTFLSMYVFWNNRFILDDSRILRLRKIRKNKSKNKILYLNSENSGFLQETPTLEFLTYISGFLVICKF